MEVEAVKEGVGEAVGGGHGEFFVDAGSVEVGVDEVGGEAREVADFFGGVGVGEVE